MENLYDKYTVEHSNFLKKNGNGNRKYTLEEIDDFHDYFCKKYNISYAEFEKMIADNYFQDSIDLFIG